MRVVVAVGAIGADLAIQVARLLGLAHIQIGGGDVIERVARHRDVARPQGLVFADHVGHAGAGVQRMQAVDAGAQHVVAGGIAQGFPGRDQRLVARQRAVGDDEAFGLGPRRHGRQPHLLGQRVAFQAAQLRGVEQVRMLAGQIQRRLRQPGAAQRGDVFAQHVGRAGRDRQRLVGLVQRLVGLAQADVDVAQRQAGIGIARRAPAQGPPAARAASVWPASARVMISPAAKADWSGWRRRPAR
ncbi:hypothetical protein WJ967_24325 [Achromobacter xylosoxidans]